MRPLATARVRIGMRIALLLLLLIGRAEADGIIMLGKGGPTDDDSRRAIGNRLDSARRAMTACWGVKAPDVIHVALATNADGSVASARARTAGAAAQCAAGILVATTFPAGKWSSVVEVRPPTATFRDVGGQLALRIGDLEVCQVDDPEKRGMSTFNIVIHGDGRITDVVMEKPVSPRIDACLVRWLSAMRLPEHRGGEVPYKVTIEFKGRK